MDARINLVGDYPEYFGMGTCHLWFSQGRDFRSLGWTTQGLLGRDCSGAVGAHLDPKACGSLEFFSKEHSIASSAFFWVINRNLYYFGVLLGSG